MCTTQPTNIENCPRATKIVFIRYPKHSKWYVTYKEHLNGGTTDDDSLNVEFIKNEFPSIGEIKKDVELYELQQDLQTSLDEGKDLNSHQVNENGEHPLPEKHGGYLSTPGNEIHPWSQTPKGNQPWE